VSLNCNDQNLLLEELKESNSKIRCKREEEENQKMIVADSERETDV